MAEPAKRKNPVYDDDSSGKPVTRPDLARQEGISSNTAGGRSWSTTSSTAGRSGGASSSTAASDGGATSPTAASDGGATSPTDASDGGATSNTGSFYNPNGDGTSSLRDAEENPDGDGDDTIGSGYNSNQTGRGRARFRITRRQAAGGGVAAIIIGVTFGSLSIFQGPLEFIHMAQLMDRFHFLNQQDAEDNRLTKIARYIKDPSKPQNTRLGLVGTAVANKLETKLNDSTGLHTQFNSTSGRFLGYAVERENPEYKNLSEEEIKDKLVSTYGLDRSSITVKGATVTFDPATSRNPITAYRQELKFSRAALGAAGLSKKSAYVGTRILATRAGWTFHPIQKLDSKIQAKALEGGKKAVDKLKKQFKKQLVQYEVNGVTPEEIRAKANTTDKNGKPIPPDPEATDTAQKAGDYKSDFQDGAANENAGTGDTTEVKTKLNAKLAAGGAAGLAGMFCIVEGLAQHIHQAQYTKAMLPMMRKASEAMSVGSQAQSGQDISSLQLGFYKDFLDSKDANGNVTSTWNEATSIKSEMGQDTSNDPKYDIPKSGQVFNGNPADSLINSIPLVKQICSALSSPFGIVIGVITGGPLSTLAQQATAPLQNDAIQLAAGWMTGAPVDPLASGSDYGNYVNYGARLSANDQYAAAGGAPMSSTQELALKTDENSVEQSDFQSKSIAYRLFNAKDQRSLISRVIDSQSTSGFTQTVASLFQNFGSLFTGALKNTASLFSGSSHAASTYNYHGLKEVGFTTDELSNPSPDFANPFRNGCFVVGCHDKHTDITGIFEDAGKESNYASKVQKCFGVNISGDSTNGWTIDSKTKAVNFTGGNFPSNCQDSGNTEWLHIRFWLLDTPTIEGYDCLNGGSSTSDQSCSDVGFDNSGSGATQTTPPVSPDSVVWPFATKSSSQYNRVDQGWDIQDKPGANIYAVASGTLHVFAPDCKGGFGSDYPTEELDKSIGGPSNWLYYGHVHILPSLKNKHVNAGDLIATANVTDPQGCSKAPAGWLEIGFSQPNTDAPIAHGTAASPEGQKMKDILLKASPAQGAAK